MPNTLLGTHRLPRAPQAPARPGFGPGNMPPLPPRPLTPAPKVGAPIDLDYAPPHPPAILVMPPVMPPLPALPPTPPPRPGWTAARNPSAQMVQQQYVQLRLEELAADRKPGMKASLARLNDILLREPKFHKYKKIPSKELLRIYEQIERNLQSADLTINFEVNAWFCDENDSDTYTQMYQRALVNGKMQLQSTGGNDARDRAAVDSQVTFPSNWQGAQTAPRRGLAPTRQGPDRIMRQMDTGELKPSSEKRGAWEAGNKYFNANTKQIFIGLNYGRRPHGSTTRWGHSYFVLKNSLKPGCFYYPGDTFDQKGTSNHAGNLQTPFDNLGAILGRSYATPTGESPRGHLSDDIVEGCYRGKILADTGYMASLIEAHHFGELRFSEHVEYMVISSREGLESNWPIYAENARKFAKKHGFRLFRTN